MTAYRLAIALLSLIGCLICLQTEADGQESADRNAGARAELLTLEQAVALALGDNRQVKNAALEVSKFDDRAAATRTQRLPEFKVTVLGSQLLSRLDFRFDKGAFGNYPGVGPIPGNDTTISTPRSPNVVIVGQINQPLSQLYRIGLGLRRLDVGREMAAERARLQRQTVVNDVRRAYYAVLQTESALHTATEAIKLYQELDRVTGEYVVQRVALKAEGLEVKTRLAKAEFDSGRLRDQLASQKEQLNQLIGRDINTEFSVSPTPALSYYETDPAAARARALEQRPEIQEARLKVKHAEYDRRIKRSEYIPDVSLTFNYISPQNLNFVPRQISSVGVMMSWEPFDWGRKKRELAEKGKAIEQAQHDERETESLVLMEVNSKFRKLQQTRQLLAVNQLAQEAAREQVRVTSNRYAVQAALLRDVLQAQTSLAEANHQYQQSLLDFWAARADFEKAIGGDQ
jgi:outer membrane protein